MRQKSTLGGGEKKGVKSEKQSNQPEARRTRQNNGIHSEQQTGLSLNRAEKNEEELDSDPKRGLEAEDSDSDLLEVEESSQPDMDRVKDGYQDNDKEDDKADDKEEDKDSMKEAEDKQDNKEKEEQDDDEEILEEADQKIEQEDEVTANTALDLPEGYASFPECCTVVCKDDLLFAKKNDEWYKATCVETKPGEIKIDYGDDELEWVPETDWRERIRNRVVHINGLPEGWKGKWILRDCSLDRVAGDWVLFYAAAAQDNKTEKYRSLQAARQDVKKSELDSFDKAIAKCEEKRTHLITFLRMQVTGDQHSTNVSESENQVQEVHAIERSEESEEVASSSETRKRTRSSVAAEATEPASFDASVLECTLAKDDMNDVDPSIFLTECWECKFGKWAPRKNGRARCRLNHHHRECDWREDARAADVAPPPAKKKAVQSELGKKQEAGPSVLPVPSKFLTTCWKCAKGPFKARKHSRKICREKLGHTTPDWRDALKMPLKPKTTVANGNSSIASSAGVNKKPRTKNDLMLSSWQRNRDASGRSKQLPTRTKPELQKSFKSAMPNTLREKDTNANRPTRAATAALSATIGNNNETQMRGCSGLQDDDRSTRPQLLFLLEKEQENLVALNVVKREDARQMGLLMECLKVPAKNRTALQHDLVPVLKSYWDKMVEEKTTLCRASKESHAAKAKKSEVEGLGEDEVGALQIELGKARDALADAQQKRADAEPKLKLIREVMKTALREAKTLHRMMGGTTKGKPELTVDNAERDILEFAASAVPSAELCLRLERKVGSVRVKLAEAITASSGPLTPEMAAMKKFQHLVSRLMQDLPGETST